MSPFLIYEGKAALELLVFYLFYRFLLKKETFHRLNRIVLVGSMILSFILPMCVITIRRPAPLMPVKTDAVYAGELISAAASSALTDTPWWSTALMLLFFAGVAFVLVRVVVSSLSVVRIIRRGTEVGEEDGCRIVVTEREIAPFSWMRYVVMPRKDWDGLNGAILTHEKAHIRYGHSVELLVVDILSAFQWFNPAVWMLRADLRELHEYEADDAVLRSGVDDREYQSLLIQKAVGKSGYSAANSFNQSTLQNRFAMMSRPKSLLRGRLRMLYLLPLVCLSLALQARTVTEDRQMVFILRQAWGTEAVISREEFRGLDTKRIRSVEVLQDASANDKIVITMKMPQELEEIVVARQKKDDGERIPFYLLEPEILPSFQGGEMNNFSRWVNAQISVPKSCRHAGTMKVGFVVDTEGCVKEVKILSSVCEELDAMMLDIVSKSPQWEPARTADGTPVAQFLTLPIEFAL